MKYLHIMRNDKFINPSIDFINKNFSKEENIFFVIYFKRKKFKEYFKKNYFIITASNFIYKIIQLL